MRNGGRINNKFLNAKRFVSIQKTNGLVGKDNDIESEYFDYKESILNSFKSFDISEASTKIYHLLWNNICDKWIEQSKTNPITDSLDFILNDFEPIFRIIISSS
ncbi:hypothetical protein EBU94_02300 [bacterium]|nr:hypothetical protein [bacterium]